MRFNKPGRERHIVTTFRVLQPPAVQSQQPVHPLGSNARVLLSSVFGPYAQDDAFGESIAGEPTGSALQ